MKSFVMNLSLSLSSFLKFQETWWLSELPEEGIQLNDTHAEKRYVNGKIMKYKARLVVKGFSQVEGIDDEETFTPMVMYNVQCTYQFGCYSQ